MINLSEAAQRLDRVRAGIAPYKHEQAVVRRVIRMEGGRLTADRFDAVFGDSRYNVKPNGDKVEYPRRARLRMWPRDRGAVILGGMQRGDWSKWLDLAQCMCAAGYLRVVLDGHLDKPEVVYTEA